MCGGTSDAISLTTEALRGLHQRPPLIAVEDPGSPSARAAILSASGTLLPIDVDDAGLDPDLIRDQVDAILLTPAHQCPLGAVMPVERRQRLLARAAAIDAVVIEDDYDSEFRHHGAPLPALAALDTAMAVVHLGTFSENLDPALRCSYLITPPTGPVAHAVRAAREARGPVVADTVQLAIAHLIRTGALRRHIECLRRDYSHKRTLITRRLPELAARGVQAHALNGGLHAVLTWNHFPDSDTVVQKLTDEGICVADLTYSRVHVDDEQEGIVLGFGAATVTQLNRTITAIVGSVS